MLFLANPLVGAAVGAGALLAQKLMNNPIDQMFSYEYRVTGSWADPVVARVERPRRRGAIVGGAGKRGEREMSERMRVAAVQTVAGGDVAENLAQAGALVAAAAAQGARLIVLPEYFGILGARATDKLRGARSAMATDRSRISWPGWRASIAPSWSAAACRWPPTTRRAYAAHASSTGPTARASRATTRSTCSGSAGARRTTTRRARSFRAARSSRFDAPCGRVGLSICYDVRFPELYRALGDCALLLVPAAFTATTGAAHWEMLLRARAVENECYVLAAAQGGAASQWPAHVGAFDARSIRGA